MATASATARPQGRKARGKPSARMCAPAT